MKRANGTGGVVRLSGNRRKPYAVRVSFRDERGRVVQRCISYHAKAAEAQAALEAYNAGRNGITADLAGATLDEIFKAWMERKKANGISELTLRNYTSIYKSHFSPIGSRVMASLRTDDIQRIFDKEAAEGVLHGTMRNERVLIGQLFNYALERDIVSKNYATFLVIPPTREGKRRGAIAIEQVMALLDAADCDDGALFASILCFTGFRISEFTQLTAESYKDGCLQGGLKTKAGKNRIVPVSGIVQPLVDKLLSNGTETLCGMKKNDARERITAALSDVGADGATPHWCRHTFASMMQGAGVDPLVRKWLLGHSTDQDITEHYTHSTMEQLRSGIAVLDAWYRSQTVGD